MEGTIYRDFHFVCDLRACARVCVWRCGDRCELFSENHSSSRNAEEYFGRSQLLRLFRARTVHRHLRLRLRYCVWLHIIRVCCVRVSVLTFTVRRVPLLLFFIIFSFLLFYWRLPTAVCRRRSFFFFFLPRTQAVRNMFSFAASESILAEFTNTRYTYVDAEEKQVRACVRLRSCTNHFKSPDAPVFEGMYDEPVLGLAFYFHFLFFFLTNTSFDFRFFFFRRQLFRFLSVLRLAVMITYGAFVFASI